MRIKSTAGRRAGRRREGGQTLLEFALVIGLLLLLVFGIIDFARAFFAFATMSNGVREGARYGIVHPTKLAEDDIKDRARAMMVIIGGTEPVITVTSPTTDTTTYPDAPYCPHYCKIVVEAQSHFDVWTPVIPDFDIVAKATMHYE
jgi:Flp pilus assembly protein TadG